MESNVHYRRTARTYAAETWTYNAHARKSWSSRSYDQGQPPISGGNRICGRDNVSTCVASRNNATESAPQQRTFLAATSTRPRASSAVCLEGPSGGRCFHALRARRPFSLHRQEAFHFDLHSSSPQRTAGSHRRKSMDLPRGRRTGQIEDAQRRGVSRSGRRLAYFLARDPQPRTARQRPTSPMSSSLDRIHP